jgi:hypothetical protein
VLQIVNNNQTQGRKPFLTLHAIWIGPVGTKSLTGNADSACLFKKKEKIGRASGSLGAGSREGGQDSGSPPRGLARLRAKYGQYGLWLVPTGPETHTFL